MERSSRPARTISKLPSSIQQQVNSYALVAAAAGVSVLALTEPAHAKIVYTHTDLKFGPRGTIFFDLNHDGINDFELVAAYGQSGDTYGYAHLSVWPSPKNEVWGQVVRRPYASALHDQVRIGPKGRFLSNGRLLMAGVSGSTHIGGYYYGLWAGQPGHRTVKDRYLGLRFIIKGKTHFGWARLRVTSAPFPIGITATLTGYAYETIPNKSIGAGVTQGPEGNQPSTESFVAPPRQPVTLGLLALGSPALSVWRREE